MKNLVKQVREWQAIFANAGVSQHDIDLCANYVMRPEAFSFEKVPEKHEAPKEQHDYFSKAVAIDEQYVYQSFGRNAFVRHDRAALEMLPLPEQNFGVRYENGKSLIAERQGKTIGANA